MMPRCLNFMCQLFRTVCLSHLHRSCAYTSPMKMGRVFRNVGKYKSHKGESPNRKNTRFTTRWMFQFKFVGATRSFKILKKAIISLIATERKHSIGVCCVPLLWMYTQYVGEFRTWVDLRSWEYYFSLRQTKHEDAENYINVFLEICITLNIIWVVQ